MSVQVYSLASGSSGNAMLIRGSHGDLLVDCGMSRLFLESAIRGTGAQPHRLKGVVLTHEHTDHARGALAMARRYGVPIIASRGTLEAVVPAHQVSVVPLPPLAPLELEEFSVVGYPVSHDAREPLALSIQSGRSRICYAVDLGEPDQSLMQAFAGASLVVLESNHDVRRLVRGPYTPDLKERILSRQGHLSNQDAARIISEISPEDRPIQFWLAHLSAVNNSPNTALRTTRRALREVGKLHCGVSVALRDRPSLHWSSDAHWWQPQLSFDW